MDDEWDASCLPGMIEDFKAHHVPFVRFRYRGYFIHELQDAGVARGRCASATYAFDHVLQSMWPERNTDCYPAHVGVLFSVWSGQPIHSGHYCNLVLGTVVDWTARQFDADTPWPLVEPLEVYTKRLLSAALTNRDRHSIVPSPCAFCAATNAGPCPPPGLITPLLKEPA